MAVRVHPAAVAGLALLLGLSANAQPMPARERTSGIVARPPANCSAEAMMLAARQGVAPRLEGCRFDAVHPLLARAKVQLDRRDRPLDVTAGLIARQNPRAGSPLEPARRVAVVVSSGPRPGRPQPQPQPESRPRPQDRPQPQDRPGPAQADLSVSIEPQLARGRVGQPASAWIVVRNAGPAQASRIELLIRSRNIEVATVRGACTRLPCLIRTLEPGATAGVMVTGRVEVAGPFGQDVMVRAAEPDPRQRDNRASFDRVAEAPRPPVAEQPPVTPPVTPVEPPPVRTEPPAVSDWRPEPPVTDPERPAASGTPASDVAPASDTPAASDVAPASGSSPASNAAPPSVSDAPVVSDTASASETAPPVIGRPPTPVERRRGPLPGWLWIVVAGVAVTGAGVGAWLAKSLAARHAHWDRLVSVVPTLDPEVEAEAEPIAMAAPAIGASVRLESGEAEPDGPIPLRKELEDA